VTATGPIFTKLILPGQGFSTECHENRKNALFCDKVPQTGLIVCRRNEVQKWSPHVLNPKRLFSLRVVSDVRDIDVRDGFISPK
jgi:hypothetical protein